MIQGRMWPRSTTMLASVGGPLILGAVIGLPFGTQSVLRQSVTLPLIVLGLALLMAPALYIGLSLVGAAPPATQVVRSVGRGLRAKGIVLAGLAPAAAFLVTTASHVIVTYALATLVLAGAALVGMRRVYRELFPDGASLARATALFVAWAVVSLLLGAQLLFSTWRMS